jgi:hypothetical protein
VLRRNNAQPQALSYRLLARPIEPAHPLV